MLFELYNEVLNRRDAINSKIGRDSAKINEARDIWVEYEPRPLDSNLAGIDSSFNYRKYKGFYIYALAGVSITSKDNLVDPIVRVDVDNTRYDKDGGRMGIRNLLLIECMKVEYELARRSLGNSNAIDLILIDGSILARMNDERTKRYSRVKDLYKNYNDLLHNDKVLFIAKNSESNSILKGMLADIYYFSKAGTKPGYAYEHQRINDEHVTVAYVRLRPCTPVIRVEIPGKKGEDNIRKVMDTLVLESISGYPYVLKLAHERCKVSDDNMSIIESMLGFSMEEGEREVVDE